MPSSGPMDAPWPTPPFSQALVWILVMMVYPLIGAGSFFRVVFVLFVGHTAVDQLDVDLIL